MKKLLVLMVAVLLVLAFAIPSMAGLKVSGRLETGFIYDPYSVTGYFITAQQQTDMETTDGPYSWDPGTSGPAYRISSDLLNSSFMRLLLSFDAPSTYVKIPLVLTLSGPAYAGRSAWGSFGQPNELTLHIYREIPNTMTYLDYSTTPFYVKYAGNGSDDEYNIWGTTSDPLQMVHSNADNMPKWGGNSNMQKADRLQLGGSYAGVKLLTQFGFWEPMWQYETNVALATTLTTNVLGYEVGFLNDYLLYPWDLFKVGANNMLWVKGDVGLGKLTVGYADYYLNSDPTAFLGFADLSGVDLAGFKLNVNVMAREEGFDAPLSRQNFLDESPSQVAYSTKRAVDIVANNPHYIFGESWSVPAGQSYFYYYVRNFQATEKYEYQAIPDRPEWTTGNPGKMRLFAEAKGKLDLFGAKTTLSIFDIYCSGFGEDTSEAMYNALGVDGNAKLGKAVNIDFNAAAIMSLTDADFTAIPLLVDASWKFNKNITLSGQLHAMSWTTAAADGMIYDVFGKVETGKLIKGMTNDVSVYVPMGEDDSMGSADSRLQAYGALLKSYNDYKKTFDLSGLGMVDCIMNVSLFGQVDRLMQDEQRITYVPGVSFDTTIVSGLSVKLAGALAQSSGDAPLAMDLPLYYDRYGYWGEVNYRVGDNSTLKAVYNVFNMGSDDYVGTADYENLYLIYNVSYADSGWSLSWGKNPICAADGEEFEAWDGKFFEAYLNPAYYGEKPGTWEEYMKGEENSTSIKASYIRLKFWVKF
ncbi:MAG: hypothetical protein ACM3WV_10965 [Bacillota bacterium]